MAGRTTARDITEVPSFSRIGGEAPGSRVAIRVSAVVPLKVFLCKTGKCVKAFQFCVQTGSSLKVIVEPPWVWNLTCWDRSRGCEVAGSPSVGTCSHFPW